jgi:dephospho-CoA kinase
VSDRWPGKTVIGLTGNIATGKSVVRRMLEHLGAFSIDADSLAHRAMSPGAPAYKPIIENFGRWVLNDEGQIDRAKLGRIVFADPGALAQLEGITHPVVRGAIDLLVRRSRQKVVAIEAIKLYESGLAGYCDTVWVVDAPEALQLERLTDIRKMSKADAQARIDAQSAQSDKLARAKVIIHNGTGYEDTYNQVKAALASLIGAPEPGEAAVIEEAPVAVQPIEGAAGGELAIRRGGPEQAGPIAEFLNGVNHSSLKRDDIMTRFGTKAYMLAMVGKKIVGLAGWQVENLITRVDEFLLAPDAPVKETVGGLLSSIESGSNDLQSEIALVFLKNNTPQTTQDAVQALDYLKQNVSELKIPDWREAAQESAPPETFLVAKRLRADRILKPI